MTFSATFSIICQQLLLYYRFWFYYKRACDYCEYPNIPLPSTDFHFVLLLEFPLHLSMSPPVPGDWSIYIYLSCAKISSLKSTEQNKGNSFLYNYQKDILGRIETCYIFFYLAAQRRYRGQNSVLCSLQSANCCSTLSFVFHKIRSIIISLLKCSL